MPTKKSTPNKLKVKKAASDNAGQNNLTQQRKKLWELQSRFHCSVIGTCLTRHELRQLCHKANIVTDSMVSDYELHRSFVNIAEESNYPSRLLNKKLDNKYKQNILHLRKIHSNIKLGRHWLEAKKSGDVAGSFWALVTHPDITDTLLDTIHADIHMLSHLAGASIHIDMQTYTLQCQRVANLESQLIKIRQDKKRIKQDKEKIIQTLSERLTKAHASERRLQQLERQLIQFKNDSVLSKLRQELAEVSIKLETTQTQNETIEKVAKQWQQLALSSENRNLRLEQKLAESQQERDAMETLLTHFISGSCQDSCSINEGNKRQNLDLCNRCILYVGGRSNQKSHFRTLVERHNGRFIHHDGGREDNRQYLSAVLPRADAVLCPLDCISHDAVRRIKQFCHRHDKPLIMLPRGSLSAFAQGLTRVAS